jgi:hypothetical protein
MQRTLDLSTAHRGRNRLAKFRFSGPKFLGQPAADLQKSGD